MVRLFGVALALAAISLPMEAEGYNWWGNDHACIVDSATGLIAGEHNVQDDAFKWTGAPKSFRIQFKFCDEVPKTQTGWGTCDKVEHVIIRTPNLQGEQHIGWRSSERRVFNSMDSYDTIGLTSNGRFYFSSLSATSDDKREAWFTMTGSCTPFDE